MTEQTWAGEPRGAKSNEEGGASLYQNQITMAAVVAKRAAAW